MQLKRILVSCGVGLIASGSAALAVGPRADAATTQLAANIAEGHGRLRRGDFVRDLSFAKGSLVEAETHLIIANRITLINDEMFSALE